MPFDLYTYRRVSDVAPALRGLPPASGRAFLAAASLDREILARMLGDAPKTYAVLRWDELYRFFSEELKVPRPRVQLDPPDHWLVLRELLARSLERLPGAPPGARRAGFLSVLASQIHELLREEISPGAIEGLFDDGSAGRVLADVYRRYIASLDEKNLSDSRGVTTETRRLLDLSGAGEVCRRLDLVLVGFSSFTHSQLALLRALVGRGASVRVFAPVGGVAGAYGAAQQFGVEGAALSRAAPFAAMRLQGGDPRQEYENAARCLALWERGRGPLAALGEWPGWESVGACVPASRMDLAGEVFSRYGLPCRRNFRLRVSQTPLWRLSASCLDAAAGGWQTEPVLRLLGSPWLSGFDFDAASFRAKRPRGKDAWRGALAGSDGALADFQRCVSFAEAIAGGGTALDLLLALRAFARGRALAVSRRLVGRPELDDALAVFSETLRELDRKILYVREVVRDIGEFGQKRLSGQDARAYLGAWADGTTVAQGRPEAGCMAVFADAPPPLFSCPYWFVFGADTSRWPGSLKESPVLDESRKERLHASSALTLDRSHLPLLAERRRQREFLFRRLLACGERVTFVCFSVADDDGRPLEPTLFLDSAEREGWIEQAFSPVERGLGRLLADEAEDALAPIESRAPDPRRENALPPSRSFRGELAARTARVRLSGVDCYAGCPYRFALRELLAMPEPPLAGEYDRLRGGAAIHALWERVWREYVAGGYADDLESLAVSRFDEVAGAVYPELTRSPALRRARAMLTRRVRRGAKRQAEMEPALRPRRTATECEMPLPPLSVNGVTFSGRCDRIDRLDDGRFLLWDYKTGGASAYAGAFQLACYALALESGGAGRCGGWGYIGLKDGGISGLWDADLRDDLRLPAPRSRAKETAMDGAKELLERIAASARTGNFPPDYGSALCRACPYAALCRKGELTGGLGDGDGNGEEESADE